MTSTVVDGRRVWLRLLQRGDAELITRFFWRSLVLGLSRNATMRYESGYVEADIPLRPTG